MALRRQLPPELHRLELIQSRVIVRLRLGYLLALSISVLFLVLYPVWIGQTYHQEDGSWRFSCLRFELGGQVSGDRCPLWDPPRTQYQETETKVRWPWQQPYRPCHVEIDVANGEFWLLTSIVVLGFAFKMACMTFAPGKNDWFITGVWWVTLLLLVVLFGYLFVALQLPGAMG